VIKSLFVFSDEVPEATGKRAGIAVSAVIVKGGGSPVREIAARSVVLSLQNGVLPTDSS